MKSRVLDHKVGIESNDSRMVMVKPMFVKRAQFMRNKSRRSHGVILLWTYPMFCYDSS